MNTKNRWGLTVAVCLALGLFLWARELASWRPQKVGVWPNARLIEDLAHGPWILTPKQLINAESGHKIAVPAGAKDYSKYHFSPDGRSFAFSNLKRGMQFDFYQKSRKAPPFMAGDIRLCRS